MVGTSLVERSYTSVLPLQGAWVQFLVRDLRSHKLCSIAWPNNKTQTNKTKKISMILPRKTTKRTQKYIVKDKYHNEILILH